MSLMMGLSALDEFYREGDRRELRDRDRKRFGWESQRSEAEMSLLGDKTAAERLGYQDRAGESGARIATRPRRTANEIVRLGQEGYSLERAGVRQPMVEDTTDAKVNYALADAKFGLAQQPIVQDTQRNTNEVGLQNSANALQNNPARLETNTNQTMIGLNQSRADLAQQPMKIAQQAAQGALTQLQAQGQLLSGLSDAIQTGNPNIVRGYIQDSLNTGLFPDQKGKTVGEVGSAKGADGKPMIVAKDSAGQVIFQMSMAELQRVRDAMSKPETMKVNEGDSVVQVRGGRVTPLYTAPTSPGKSMEREGKKPVEQQLAEWLIKSRVAPNEAEAWKMVRSSKEKSRASFVQEYVLKTAGIQDASKAADDAGKMWDSQNQPQGGGPAAGGPRATPAAPAAQPGIDPALKKLLGIP